MTISRKVAVETRTVSFDVPAADSLYITAIVSRVADLIPTINRLSMRMDLCAVHANGCPMDFRRLSEADDLNLIHDVIGIENHLDRSTGFLDSRFHPRFASKQTITNVAA